MPTDRSTPRPGLDLFLVSFLILFFELAAIRWFGSTVVFLTFFTNIVLLASFVGMTVGCLAASGKRDLVRIALPLTLAAMGLALGLLWAWESVSPLVIEVGNQSAPQQIFFGTNYRSIDPSKFVVPIEVVAGFFFVLVASIFVGLGQVLGRTLDAHPHRLAAYTINIGGSLAGIAAFALSSHLATSPHLWFLIVVAATLRFVRPWSGAQIACALGVLFVAGATSYRSGEGVVSWSPYYKVCYEAKTGAISTNNMTHQDMYRVGEHPEYQLPHLLNREAGNSPFEKVLVIGAGSGNDVRAALDGGATRVDAGEIDPVLQAIGAADHPDEPYADERVHVHLTDGRRFVRRTDERYDFALYALVDSLVLHSGYSSIRLESFLFTKEALADVKAVLAPDGVFAMYNYYRRGWIVGRLVRLAREVFGTEPIVLDLGLNVDGEAAGPSRIDSSTDQSGHFTLVLAGSDSARLQAIAARFREQGPFWLPRTPGAAATFAAERPAGGEWLRIEPAEVVVDESDQVPADDWPFLYLRERAIPTLNLRGMAMISVLSLGVLVAFAPVRTLRPNGQMFFLGAAFMLLETRGVVHMALLFGSTWVVNSVVFAAVLLMILGANALVLLLGLKRQGLFYALLLAALAANLAIPMNSFLGLADPWRTTVSAGVVFVPLLFAGIVFAIAFSRSARPDVDFGSNVAGAVLGGLTEYSSLVLGFDRLLLVGIGFYVLSFLLRPRSAAS